MNPNPQFVEQHGRPAEAMTLAQLEALAEREYAEADTADEDHLRRVFYAMRRGLPSLCRGPILH